MRRGAGLLWAAAICTAVALLSIGVAGASATGSASFPDRVGDAGTSVDITGVDVETRDGYFGPTLGVRVNVAGSYDWDSGQAGVIVALDLDQNPDTGSAFYGTEVEFVFQGGMWDSQATMYRFNGWDFRRVEPPDFGLSWGWNDHFMEFFTTLADIGLAPDAGFNVVAAVPSVHTDTAPDLGTFNYQVVPGTPPPPLGPDTRAPHVAAYPATARRGTVADLKYWALDGRGETAETIRIYRGARLLKTIRVPLSSSNPFDLSHVSWRVPRDLRGRLRYSVRSVDAAGNRSTLSWNRLLIR
jgi:hypothetical protein